MLKRFVTQIVSLVMVVFLIIAVGSQPASAVTLTGDYVEDGNAVVEVLRQYIDPQVDYSDEELEEIATEVQDTIESFYSRYRGRYSKTRSFTTFQTIFNTLASNYRGRTQPRKLKSDQQDRVLSQLEQAEVALRRGL